MNSLTLATVKADVAPLTRRPARVAVLGAALVWGIGLAAGMSSATVFPIAATDPDHHPWTMWGAILSTNASVALGLVAGVVTLGTASVVGGFVVATYTGAVWHACWAVTGLAATAQRLLPFFAFELAALFCATVSGLLPLTTALAGRPAAAPTTGWRGAVSCYLAGLAPTLPWLAATALGLVVAASLEILQGVPR